MKRSEMIDHIKEELEEFVEAVHTSSASALQHRIRSKADAILAFMEGFGMLPPLQECKIVESDQGPKHSQVKREWDEE